MENYLSVLFLFILASVFAQSEFNKAAAKFPDKATKNMLETFKSSGIEKFLIQEIQR